MNRAVASLNLFDLADIDDARAEVERAEAARNKAARRVLSAPRGAKKERDREYLEATNAALRAEAQLSKLEIQAGLR